MTIERAPGVRRPWSGFVALFALAAAAGCNSDAEANGSPEERQETAFQRVINVEVRELEESSFVETARIAATARANRDVQVSAEESGVIRELPVEKGRVVEVGDPIARIDDRHLEAQVREAEARAALARETWERRRRLFEVDGVGSELQYLEARYQAEQAEAALDHLRERLARTVLRAPVTGILESREVEVGTMVSPGAPVARIVQIDPIRITGGAPERFAPEIATGSPARVTFDVLPGEVLTGPLTYVGATVNPRNRTFPVELVVRNPGRVIKPEMVASLEITRRERDGVIVIPQEAVVRVEEGFVAFVAVERGGVQVVEVRRLELGGSERNRVLVEEGLRAGDRLIVVGQNQVADGDRIRIVEGR